MQTGNRNRPLLRLGRQIRAVSHVQLVSGIDLVERVDG